MGALVLLQNVCRRETTATVRAQVLPDARVNGHVGAQRCLLVEPPIADLADERLNALNKINLLTKMAFEFHQVAYSFT